MMGRPKKAPPEVPLPNRLNGETEASIASANRSATPEDDPGYLPDGSGGTMAPEKFPELEAAAEAHRNTKRRIADLKTKLDGELYSALKDAYDKYESKIPGGVYKYYDNNDEPLEIGKDAEPRVSVRKVKKPKPGQVSVTEGNGFGGGDQASLDALDDEEEEDGDE